MLTSRWKAGLAVAAALAGGLARAEQPTASERWQAMANADLDAVHALVRDAHPGVIDDENPGFNAWVDAGYDEAKALIPFVRSYDNALAVVRYYTSGFEDGHFAYSDDIREDFPVIVTGWNITRQDRQYVVAASLSDWPAPLPPVGAQWTGCDGLPAETVLRTRIGPFSDRRSDEGSERIRIASLWKHLPTADNLRNCTFVTRSGQLLNFPVAYHPIDQDLFFDSFPRGQDGSRRAVNDFEIKENVLWVRAGNFDLRAESAELEELNAMLDGLRATGSTRAIVFDVRGNGGGDSGIGDRILEAATGGLEFDQVDIDSLPRYFAQWRVSDHLIRYLSSFIDRLSSLYGPSSTRTAKAIAFRDKVIAARAAGERWVEQDAGRTLSRDDVIARRGRLRRTDARLFLLTDSGCASACLDFADVVLQVPGATHIGQTTSADSVYMVGSDARMPSGNHVIMPVKVWRNRPRGNNQPYVPDIAIDLSAAEPEIRRQVLRVLDGE